MTTRQSRSFIGDYGQTITKIQHTDTGTKDDWGDKEYNESTATVTAIVSRPSIRSDPETNSSGYEPAGLVNIALSSTVDVYDGAGTEATEWKIDDKRYNTLKYDTQHNGIIMVQAERMREE